MSLEILLKNSNRLKKCQLHNDISPIKNKYKSLVKFKDNSNFNILIGSIDIDKCLEENEPSAPRWDYLIIIKPQIETALFVEIHPVNNSEITKMIDKYLWLNDLINSELCELKSNPKKYKHRFIWLAHDKTSHLNKNTSEFRKLTRYPQITIFKELFLDEIPD